jgi:hypothetical protein
MATAVQHKPTAFDKWKQTINSALTNSKWDEYDCFVIVTANQFNQYLKSTSGFKQLEWKIIKAMIWTETGGPSDPSWKSRPMQIGNPGDKGLAALFSGKEGGDLIMPPSLKMTAASATASPQGNIQAGVAYLLMRSAKYGFKTVSNGPISDYVVKPGDSFAKIAQQGGSTAQWLEQLNPTVHILHPKQTIKFQKAKLQKIVTGWNPITTTTIAHKYNVGDPNYAKKLDYCLDIMKKANRTPTCN